jgi:UDP-3-O-[3-hydroxymyristoyl] glucosamine N-acyltransferase
VHQQPFNFSRQPKTRAEVAKLLGGELHGEDALVRHLADPDVAGVDDLVCVLREKTALEKALVSTAEVLVLATGAAVQTNKALIRVPDVELAWLELLRVFALPLKNLGIDSSAIIHPSAIIEPNVQIGAFAVIGADARIGDGSIIGAYSSVGERSSLGEGCLLHERVTIRHDCQLGNGVLVQSGAVIGADGFGFHRTANGFIRQEQIGAVQIADHVEIGANTVIDRGTLEPTRIGRGTKIGPSCVIAHNCQLGANVILIGMVGLTGSVIIEDDAVLWGGTGTIGHCRIGKGAVLTARSALSKDIPAGEVWRGEPAQPIKDQLRLEAQMRRLEDYEKRLKLLEQSYSQVVTQQGDNSSMR